MLTRLQRGAVIAIILAIVGGISLLMTTFVTEANVFSNIGIEDRQARFSQDGYRVVYTRDSNEVLTNFHFSACQDISDFQLLDDKWRKADSEDFHKIVCK